jgi:hypothetical protein
VSSCGNGSEALTSVKGENFMTECLSASIGLWN